MEQKPERTRTENEIKNIIEQGKGKTQMRKKRQSKKKRKKGKTNDKAKVRTES